VGICIPTAQRGWRGGLALPWPSYTVDVANCVWCVAYKRGIVRGGGGGAQKCCNRVAGGGGRQGGGGENRGWGEFRG